MVTAIKYQRSIATSSIKSNHTIKNTYLQSGKMYKYSSLDDMRHVSEILESKLLYQLPICSTPISRDYITSNHFEFLT